MKDEFVAEYVDGKFYVMIPLNTSDRTRAIAKASEVLDDLLNCIDITKRNTKDSPQFIKAIKKISKNIWSIIK